MEDIGHFKINVSGVEYVADTIMNFELYGTYYCIYGIRGSDSNYQLYCGEVVGNTVIPIRNEKDKLLTDKIILALGDALKEENV